MVKLLHKLMHQGCSLHARQLTQLLQLQLLREGHRALRLYKLQAGLCCRHSDILLHRAGVSGCGSANSLLHHSMESGRVTAVLTPAKKEHTLVTA